MASTDWREITLLYDRLLRIQPSPVVELNRAVAIAMREGPEQGLRLIDDLLARGFQSVTVLDISPSSIAAVRQRLGSVAENVHWLQDDITRAQVPSHEYDLWHDRAVFHFLIDPTDRQTLDGRDALLNHLLGRPAKQIDEQRGNCDRGNRPQKPVGRPGCSLSG